MSQNSSTMSNALSTGKFTVAGIGNEHGSSFSASTPVWTSSNGATTLGMGYGRSGAWSTNQGANHTVSVGLGFKF